MKWWTIIQIAVTSSDFNNSPNIAKIVSNIVSSFSHTYQLHYWSYRCETFSRQYPYIKSEQVWRIFKSE